MSASTQQGHGWTRKGLTCNGDSSVVFDLSSSTASAWSSSFSAAPDAAAVAATHPAGSGSDFSYATSDLTINPPSLDADPLEIRGFDAEMAVEVLTRVGHGILGPIWTARLVDGTPVTVFGLQPRAQCEPATLYAQLIDRLRELAPVVHPSLGFPLGTTEAGDHLGLVYRGDWVKGAAAGVVAVITAAADYVRHFESVRLGVARSYCVAEGGGRHAKVCCWGLMGAVNALAVVGLEDPWLAPEVVEASGRVYCTEASETFALAATCAEAWYGTTDVSRWKPAGSDDNIRPLLGACLAADPSKRPPLDAALVVGMTAFHWREPTGKALSASIPPRSIQLGFSELMLVVICALVMQSVMLCVVGRHQPPCGCGCAGWVRLGAVNGCLDLEITRRAKAERGRLSVDPWVFGFVAAAMSSRRLVSPLGTHASSSVGLAVKGEAVQDDSDGRRRDLCSIQSEHSGVVDRDSAVSGPIWGFPSWVHAFSDADLTGSEPLGRGAFGVVTKRLLFGSTEVAVKQVAVPTRRGPSAEKFSWEIAAHVMLSSHPNTVSLLGLVYDEAAGSVGLVCELMDHDLAGWLQVPRPLAERATVLCSAAAGLAFLHSKGLVHRDIKPANIFVSDQCPLTAKIGDFGLTSVVGGREGWTRTYAAPEVLLRDDVSTAASDAYSFGLVVYEVLAGVEAMPTGKERRGKERALPWVVKSDLPVPDGQWASMVVRALSPDRAWRLPVGDWDAVLTKVIATCRASSPD